MRYEPCMTPNCKNLGIYRGLCSGCYGAARKMVKKGKVTFKFLEGKGLIRPVKVRGLFIKNLERVARRRSK